MILLFFFKREKKESARTLDSMKFLFVEEREREEREEKRKEKEEGKESKWWEKKNL